jgi:hypothetical protein
MMSAKVMMFQRQTRLSGEQYEQDTGNADIHFPYGWPKISFGQRKHPYRDYPSDMLFVLPSTNMNRSCGQRLFLSGWHLVSPCSVRYCT